MKTTVRVTVKTEPGLRVAVQRGFRHLGFGGVGDYLRDVTDQVAARASSNAEDAIRGMGDYVHPFMDSTAQSLVGVVVNNHPAALSAEFGSRRRPASAPLRRALD